MEKSIDACKENLILLHIQTKNLHYKFLSTLDSNLKLEIAVQVLKNITKILDIQILILHSKFLREDGFKLNLTLLSKKINKINKNLENYETSTFNRSDPNFLQ